MKPLLPSHLDLDLPDGKGVDFPPPVWPFNVYLDWLQEQHEERVRQGTAYLHLSDPHRCPVDAPFRLD